MAVQTYDPRSILMTVGGFPVTGLDDGVFLKVAMNDDAFSLKVGAGGEAARARSNNNSAEITFTLLQTSLCNDLFSGLYNAGRLVPGRTDIVPLLIKDLLGTTLFSAATCWIKKLPDAEFGKEISSREWVLETDDVFSIVGGSL